jgi:HEAT repeat protein
LGNLRDIWAKQVLLSALDSNEAVIQQAAIAALGEIKAVETVEKLLTFVNSDDWLIRSD